VSDRILLVEGVEDVGFFAVFCASVDLQDIRIEPKRPAWLGAPGNGWTNVLKVLPLQLGRLRESDSGLSRLGIVIDADHAPSGGFNARYRRLSDTLAEHGYRATEDPQAGFLFEHNDGLPPVGLWIMPDNVADGMLEDFVEQSIVADQQPLLAHARSSIETLPVTLYKPIHAHKALVGTWRAWQKTPCGPLSQVVKEGAIDLNAPLAQRFKTWLKATFI